MFEGGPVDVNPAVVQPADERSMARSSRASHSISVTRSLAGRVVKSAGDRLDDVDPAFVQRCGNATARPADPGRRACRRARRPGGRDRGAAHWRAAACRYCRRTGSCRPSAAEAPGSASKAARPAAPAPSTTRLFDVSSKATASSMPRSLTRTIVVHQNLDDRAGELARLLDRDALGQCVAGEWAMAAFDDIVHRGEELGLDADHFDRLDRLGGDRRAGNQPAAADRDDQGVELWHVLEHFERDGPCPGDDWGRRKDGRSGPCSASSSRACA